eukprot:7603904-Alexandrium_andersonii.AAC.1
MGKRETDKKSAGSSKGSSLVPERRMLVRQKHMEGEEDATGKGGEEESAGSSWQKWKAETSWYRK